MSIKRWTIRLQPLSPFLIGAHRPDNNHFETLDYIPANVLQAAFARAILESHAQYDIKKHGRERRYFIDPRHSEVTVDGCRPEWKAWFQHFDDLSFSDATPLGATPYTPTTFVCKTFSDEHPLVESLPDRYRLRHSVGQAIKDFCCPACQGRLERKDGWRMHEKRVYRRVITRVQIDEKRLVSKDGHLYSLAVGEPYAFIDRARGQTEPLYFEATLFAPEHVQGLEKATDQVIRVGAYITSGLGKMAITIKPVPEPQVNNLKEIIKAWREKVGDQSIAMQLLSDVKYTGEHYAPDRYMDLDELYAVYTEWLQREAGLPSECSVSFAYLKTQNRRGFPKGKQSGREEGISHFLMNGSVFVINGPDEAVQSWGLEAAQYGLWLDNPSEKRRIPVKLLSGEAQ